MAKYISLNIFIIYFHIRYIFSFTFLLQTATINNEHYQTVHPPPPPLIPTYPHPPKIMPHPRPLTQNNVPPTPTQPK